MKKLMFALAGAALTSFAAETGLNLRDANDLDATGFEGFAAEASVAGKDDDGGTSGYILWRSSGTDESLVKAYNAEGNATNGYVTTSFLDLFQDQGNKYLALDTSGNVLTRYFVEPTVENDVTSAVPVSVSTPVYIDTLVQFTPSETEPTSEELAGAKLAIWLGIDTTANTTNLYVRGNAYDMDGEITATPTSFVLAPATGALTVQPGTWYRLTVKAIENVFAAGTGYGLPAFKILIDGQEMVATTAPVSSALQTIMTTSDYFANDDIKTDVGLNKIIPTLAAIGSDEDAVTLTQVDFKGSGAIDNFLVTRTPIQYAQSAVDFTLTWPSGLTSVSYTVDGVAGDALTLADGTATKQILPGAAVELTGSLGYANKTVSGTVTDGGTLALTADIGLYFPLTATAGQDGTAEHPYEIASATGLNALKDAIAAGFGANLCYAQKADIDMTSAGAFAGIGVYAEANPPAGTPFSGTYDGENNKILNVLFTARAYAGIFNQVNGGTIKNLVVSNATAETGTKTSASIVGHAGNGATLQNLTSEGEFFTSAAPGNHNVSGIAIRLSPMGNATLVKDCTNNATIYGSYTKMAGIATLTQSKTAEDPVSTITFDGCVNNGNLIMPSGADAGRDGLGGILGYACSAGVQLLNCVNTASTISSTLGNAKIGQLIGWTYSGAVTDQGGNAALAASKMIGDWGGATENGFLYATVDNGSPAMATTATTLVKDTTYLLEGDVGAGTVFTLAADGDTIAFDTALGYTFGGTVDAATGLEVTPSTSGTVTTYTAATPSSGSTVHPGENDGESYASQAAAEAAAADVTIEASDAVATALGSEATATYEGRFEAQAVEVSAGVWNVVVGLKASEEATLQTQADTDAGTVVGALDAGSVTINTTPGFYYSVKYGSTLDAINKQTAGELATGSTKSITLPAKSGTAGFYKVVISITPSEAQN